MESFEGRVAVVTGGGTGMGRELVRQLAAAGCHVAMCDVSDENLAETRDAGRGGRDRPARGSRPTVADVSDEAQVLALPRRGRCRSTTPTTSTCCSTTPASVAAAAS